MVLGQGTPAGIFQSIMLKPPNVKSVYPLTGSREKVDLPENVTNLDELIVFNAESDHSNDIMSLKQV